MIEDRGLRQETLRFALGDTARHRCLNRETLRYALGDTLKHQSEAAISQTTLHPNLSPRAQRRVS